MSDREKRLVIVLVVLGFLGLNAGVLKLWYLPRISDAKDTTTRMIEKRDRAMIAIFEQEDKQDEIDWLSRSEREKSWQKAVADLEALASREAERRGLTLKRQAKPLTAIEHEDLYFDRAAIEIEVSGREQILFQWLDRLNSPSDLRAVTTLRINPKKDDDTMVDCLVVLEQWFVPPPPEVPDLPGNRA
ncbi:MAG: hypothetical protein CMO40_01280 [Verrucomicrobiaceae bacterium]|nr:hypothetical protein [Verrucomicrobiaceae bacterium]